MEEIKTLKDREKDLLELGKKKGYITYEELAESLKGLDLDADDLDEIYNLLIDSHIDIVSDEGSSEGKIKEESNLVLSDEELTKDVNINVLKRNR